MRYRVIATRGVWNKKGNSPVTTSRLDFIEESGLEYKEYIQKIWKELSQKGWITNVSMVEQTA